MTITKTAGLLAVAALALPAGAAAHHGPPPNKQAQQQQQQNKKQKRQQQQQAQKQKRQQRRQAQKQHRQQQRVNRQASRQHQRRVPQRVHRAHRRGTHPHCGKLRAFKLFGTNLQAGGLTFVGNQASGPLKLDVKSANRRARDFLGITALPAPGTTLTLTNDAVNLTFIHVAGLSDVKPTDHVKIKGFVTRAHAGCATPTLDIRRITVHR